MAISLIRELQRVFLIRINCIVDTIIVILFV
jgi:hypothetical protein